MSHNHYQTDNKKVLLIALGLISLLVIAEVIGGIITNSLALLADATHMLGDFFSIGLAFLAFKFGEWEASKNKTFGYRRFEILAAVVNGVVLIGVSAFIIWHAIERFISPPEVAGGGVFLVAGLAIVINLLIAWVFIRGGDVKENLNMQGAFAHVLGDILSTIGVLISALLVIFFNWTYADPIVSIVVALLILYTGFGIVKNAVHILMEGIPKNVDVDDVVQTIQSNEEVKSVHDLHVWSITSGLNALSCHAVVDDDMSIAEGEQLLRQIENDLEPKNIHHMTIQLESPDHLHDNSILCKVKGETSAHDHHH
jgi:cobalt-zinc-cadmium efflux system protein